MDVEPETVDVGPRSLKRWLIEVRLASRQRLRYVLAERFCIFWLNVHKWRYWVFLVFGYDPHF